MARALRVLLGVFLPFLFVGISILAVCCWRGGIFGRRRRPRELVEGGGGRLEFGYREEYPDEGEEEEEGEGEREEEDLMVFPGGEDLTIHGILDAPGEVVGKSSYGTLYKASLQVKEVGGGGGATLMLLRFVRPACMGRIKEIFPVVQNLGLIRHPNLVPLKALYVGPRGEKLFVHPFFLGGSLSQFLRDANAEVYNWGIICKISLGIARGLHHLHHALHKPIIHGNLKSKNILLDVDFQPHLSDYGLHILLNPAAAQEMLEASASHGYKAPELIKMKDANTDTDTYSLGVIFLEMLTRKEPTSSNLLASWELRLPTSIRNMILEHKVSEVFCPELLRQCRNEGSATEERLLGYFQLAMSCCSPSPSLRPDIKYVVRKLEGIADENCQPAL